jgi:hypothetical protein
VAGAGVTTTELINSVLEMWPEQRRLAAATIEVALYKHRIEEQNRTRLYTSPPTFFGTMPLREDLVVEQGNIFDGWRSVELNVVTVPARTTSITAIEV